MELGGGENVDSNERFYKALEDVGGELAVGNGAVHFKTLCGRWDG